MRQSSIYTDFNLGTYVNLIEKKYINKVFFLKYEFPKINNLK